MLTVVEAIGGADADCWLRVDSATPLDSRAVAETLAEVVWTGLDTFSDRAVVTLGAVERPTSVCIIVEAEVTVALLKPAVVIEEDSFTEYT